MNCLPTLAPENIEAARVFPFVHDQMIVSPIGQVIGIDLNAVFKVMEVLKVRDKISCLEKIKMLFYEIVIVKIKDAKSNFPKKKSN
jgi:hypothetical protein